MINGPDFKSIRLALIPRIVDLWLGPYQTKGYLSIRSMPSDEYPTTRTPLLHPQVGVGQRRRALRRSSHRRTTDHVPSALKSKQMDPTQGGGERKTSEGSLLARLVRVVLPAMTPTAVVLLANRRGILRALKTPNPVRFGLTLIERRVRAVQSSHRDRRSGRSCPR